MNTIVRRFLGSLALALALAPATACTFGVLPRESMDPALQVVPPCFAGAVCAVGLDSRGFASMADVMASSRR
jgi:hypothetical protein